MYTILVVIHVLVSVALIGLVLVQHGKGADAGAAFGSGASGTVFGARGSANFLTRATSWLAAAFFAISLALAYLVHGRSSGGGSVVDGAPAAEVPAQTQAEVPAAGVVGGEAAAPPAAAEVPAAEVPKSETPAAEAPAKPKVPE